MDSRICQTSTASPAEPGGLSCWARIPHDSIDGIVDTDSRSMLAAGSTQPDAARKRLPFPDSAPLNSCEVGAVRENGYEHADIFRQLFAERNVESGLQAVLEGFADNWMWLPWLAHFLRGCRRSLSDIAVYLPLPGVC